MDLRYSIYGPGMQTISQDELIALNRSEPGPNVLLARAENSGSEGCYVEVARWSFKRKRWERYCFHKFFDGDAAGKTAVELCHEQAAIINGASFEEARLVHSLPEYKPE